MCATASTSPSVTAPMRPRRAVVTTSPRSPRRSATASLGAVVSTPVTRVTRGCSASWAARFAPRYRLTPVTRTFTYASRLPRRTWFGEGGDERAATSGRRPAAHLPRRRRWTRVLRSSLRCFFLAIRLRRFLTTEPIWLSPRVSVRNGPAVTRLRVRIVYERPRSLRHRRLVGTAVSSWSTPSLTWAPHFTVIGSASDGREGFGRRARPRPHPLPRLSWDG